MDYSRLSDRDIDALVLQRVYGNQAKDKDIMRAWLRGGFKFTTNPDNAWPIIYQNGITVACEYGNWLAGFYGHGSDGHDTAVWNSVYHANPLRAAMIVFLMMQESK